MRRHRGQNLNKIDLPPALDWEKILKGLPHFPTVRISALTGEGIERLKIEIVKQVVGTDKENQPLDIAPNLRQAKALEHAKQYIDNAAKAIREDAPLEIIAFELHNALDSLGEIVGQTTPDHILESIFNNFCIGK